MVVVQPVFEQVGREIFISGPDWPKRVVEQMIKLALRKHDLATAAARKRLHRSLEAEIPKGLFKVLILFTPVN